MEFQQLGKKQCRVCKFFDKERTQFVDGDLARPNIYRTVYCKKVGKYIEFDQKCPTIDNDGEIYTVYCTKCDKDLIQFKHRKDKKKESADLENLQILEHIDENKKCALFAYRKREDGLLGLECECGNDTRTLGVAGEDQAKFNTRSSKFKFRKK